MKKAQERKDLTDYTCFCGQAVDASGNRLPLVSVPSTRNATNPSDRARL
jgi:hypothetical protein